MKPDIKQNPHPKLRYDVTVTIDGAPGPFDSVDGFMQYEVTNKACVPETGGPMNAMRLAPMANPAIAFKKVWDNTYKGAVYADYFLDEDYFGLGVCHWSLMAVITGLNINMLTLSPDLSSEQLFAQKSVTTYFVRQDYLTNDLKSISIGETSRSHYSADRQKDIFSITLTAKESAP